MSSLPVSETLLIGMFRDVGSFKCSNMSETLVIEMFRDVGNSECSNMSEALLIEMFRDVGNFLWSQIPGNFEKIM